MSKLQLCTGPEHILIQGVRKPQAENAVQPENFNVLGGRGSERSCIATPTSQPVSQQVTASLQQAYTQPGLTAAPAHSTIMQASTLPVPSMDGLASTIDVILSNGAMLNSEITTDESHVNQSVMGQAVPVMNSVGSVIHDGTVCANEMLEQSASVIGMVAVANSIF